MINILQCKITTCLTLLFLTFPAGADLLSFGNLVYDTGQNQAWTANANLTGGTITWSDTNTWASGLNYEGFTNHSTSC